ncbi:MAG: porin [Draconibacterium sp.]|nr:porin [Draconibacterium sp.]
MKIDSIIKINHDLEGFIMPIFEHNNDANLFQLRYFRLRSRAKINQQLSYFIQFELGGIPTLKDASIDFKFSDAFIIRAGQFQYHFGVFEKPWNFPTIYVPQIKSNMLGDPRDLGIQLNGSLNKLDYYACIMNGTARGVRDDDKKKTFVFSLDYHITNNLKVGVSQYLGTRNFTEESNVINSAKRNRSGAYFWYDDKKLMIRGDFMKGTDHTYNQSGYYFIGGYHITNKIQPVFRYDYFKSEINDFSNLILAPGLNIFLSEKFYLRSIVEFNRINNNFEYGKFALELGVMFL